MDENIRFWPKVLLTETCWEWQGGIDIHGYGKFSVTRTYKVKTTMGAHRWAFEVLEYKVPDGMHLDHLCRNRACVNPDHMEVVTPRENFLRGHGQAGRNSRKTHCVHGHEFNAENTYITKEGRRKCRPCQKMRGLAYKARKKVDSLADTS